MFLLQREPVASIVLVDQMSREKLTCTERGRPFRCLSVGGRTCGALVKVFKKCEAAAHSSRLSADVPKAGLAFVNLELVVSHE